MKFRRFLASLLAVVMLTTTMMAGVVTAQAAPQTSDDADKYVTLDGEWNFKLYRTYGYMFQGQWYNYFPTTWEDLDTAVYPEDGAWKDWDTIQMPYDNPETSGLLTTDISPSWSEAWVIREFDLPADFTEDETVTLLLGVIDDNDVVYINGHMVAASGFKDANGNSTDKIPSTGGFVLNAENPEDAVIFQTSYYQISREYDIPTEVLNLGGTNEIAVRLYNNNSNGGFYSGNPYAICGNDLAVRNLKGLATEAAESPEVEATVAAQIAALAAGDMDAYAATIAENYHNDADTKADKVAAAEAQGAVTITDENAAIYVDDNGNYWYSATRTIDGATTTVELCYEVVDGVAYERGNWNRCYGTSYASELFAQNLTYSVYLPPSYYENEDTEYPVVWLLHGRASSSESYRNVDKIGAFMDEQIASGNITEMILVMPDSGKYTFYLDSELTASGKDNTGPWSTQLTEELRQVADSTYRTIDDAKFRGLTGNSMGGFGAMVTGTLNPELYSSIGVHMGYLGSWNGVSAMDSLKSLTEEQLADYDFYLDCGLQDQTVGISGTVAVHDYLESVGKEHGYELRDGIHGSAFYMAGMPASMKMHSDHFLANGLFDAELTDSTKTYDTSYPGNIDFQVELNGNVIEDVDLPEGAYAINGDTVTISYAYLNSVSQDQVSVPIVLKSGAVLTAQIKVVSSEIKNDSSPSTPKFPFTDVSKDDWFYKSVKYVYDNDVMAGVSDSAFDPDENLTRAMVAQVLYNWDEDSYSGAPAVFTDVPAGKWYTDAINWAAAEGVVSGYGNGLFGTLDNVTREQLAMILYNYAVSKDYTVSGKAALDRYEGSELVSSWAVEAVEWAVANDILRTEDGLLAPTDNATRAEVAFAMMNFCEKVAK